MLSDTFLDLLIALGLGLLVGLQKERMESPIAGLRTFALVSILGAVSALVARENAGWVIVAGVLAVTTLMVMGNVLLMKRGEIDPGQTTEVAVVLTYLVGALTVYGQREVAIVLGGTTAMLLHLREELKGWVARLSDRDVRAIMQFVVVSLVVLPVLPDRTFGPFDVLNPRQIWWMVVLIVGINLIGYATFRLMGARGGTVLGGFLGGVISSTATTMSYARLTKTRTSATPEAVAVVWIASGVVFVRILVEIGVAAPAFLRTAAGPISIMVVVFALAAAAIWKTSTATPESPLEPANPTELRPAIVFGALYATILFAVAAAERLLGSPGLFATAAVSGLTDIDAITLSTSRLVTTQVIDAHTGWRVVLLASMSNMVFKLGLVAMLGNRRMLGRLAWLFAIAIVVGVTLLFAWS